MPLLPPTLPGPGSSLAPATRARSLPNLPNFPSPIKPCKPQSVQPFGHHARPAPLVILRLLHGQLPLLRVSYHQPLDLLGLRQNPTQPLLPPHSQTQRPQVAHLHPLRSDHTHCPQAFPKAHDAAPPGDQRKSDSEAENRGNKSNFCHGEPCQARQGQPKVGLPPVRWSHI